MDQVVAVNGGGESSLCVGWVGNSGTGLGKSMNEFLVTIHGFSRAFVAILSVTFNSLKYIFIPVKNQKLGSSFV